MTCIRAGLEVLEVGSGIKVQLECRLGGFDFPLLKKAPYWLRVALGRPSVRYGQHARAQRFGGTRRRGWC